VPFADVGGNRLHYLDVGAGDVPVVLLHAFPLQAEMWRPQLACLSARTRVIAPDLKGFGRSDAPDDRSAYTMERYGDEVAGLLEHLGVGRMVLGGLSMGGYIAFAFLRRYGDMVAGLVLADTRAAADTPEVLERRTSQQELVSRQGAGAVVDTLLAGLLSDHTRSHRPELVDRVRGLMDNPGAGYIGALEAMKGRPDATAELTAIDVPTLVLVGEHDAASPPDVVRAWQERIPGSRLVVLPGAAHLSNLEVADEFNAAVDEFVAGVADRA
jgi:3-oxoadipate enol-lactonase